MTTTHNTYLAGNFAPVDEEITAVDLPVTGQIPADLAGRFLRIGPNPMPPIDPTGYHWFTGSGLVHGLRLRDGRAEWYRRRFVRDDIVCAARGWPPVSGPRHDMIGATANVANTNVIAHAGRTFATVEAGGLPVELTYELETVQRSNFDGTLDGGFTAHARRDPATGELHAVNYCVGWDHVRYVVVGVDGRVRHAVDVPIEGKPMVHDCAITARYVLLFDLPCTFDIDAAMSGASLPYRWNPAHPARVGLLPRDGTAADIRWVAVSPCYLFHPMNAYDLPDGRVIVDVVRHPRMFDADVNGPNEGPPTLERWTLDPASGRAQEQRLDDRGVEFPRLDERRLGQPYRYGYTGTFGEEVAHGPTHKWDLVAGRVESHDYGRGRVSLEPVFVPRTPDAAEDDGWIMSYVFDATTNRSDVVILHAQDFTGAPVATIHLPDRVPFGFHGNWVPDTSTAS